MDDLERQYLSTAYELAMKDPRRTFKDSEIANHLDLDPSQPNYTNRVAAATMYLKDMGFVEDNVGDSNEIGWLGLKLTRAGIEETERLKDPIEQRKELRRDFLRAVYEQANGSPTKDVYWPDLAPRFTYADMQMPPSSIEVVADQLAGMGYITIEVDEGGIYRITTKGVDEVEGNKPQDAGATVQFYGNVQGSVIGKHNTAELTNTFDFRAIEQRIEEEGGEDKEELRQALAQVQRLLERGEYLDRGALCRFSGAMERHSWFTSSVMQALLGFATQVAAGG